jgi:outer membrane phospholipase A
VRRLAFLALLSFSLCQAAAPPDWLIASPEGRAVAGESFELIVSGPAGEPLPDEIEVRLRSELEERIVQMRALGPAQNGRRSYSAHMPAGVSGPARVDLVGRDSSVLQIAVAQPGASPPGTGRHVPGEYEPPLSENDPMYFIVGARDGWSARFQLSFKYRLFDLGTGFGRDQPWLSGLYFGYTQNSIWDLSSDSKPFRDTSYEPQFFWKWDRADDKTFVDSVRVGLEHESNGGDMERSRSINTAFIRPEWRFVLANRHELTFYPKLYGYLNKDENPDIQQYRGYVDWQLRYDAAGEWVTTVLARHGTSGKGSFQLDVSKRARDLRFGPVGGYFHLQYFTGYGESILDYTVRRPSQLRIGFAIVP